MVNFRRVVGNRVLLTGGAGFIGSHLCRALLDEGYEVDVVDNLSSGRAENIPAGSELFELDLGTDEAVAQLPERDYAAILHLAGQSSGELSFSDPAYDFDANARSTLLLSSWALERGVPALIHASSMGVYGQPERHPVAEDAPLSPLSWYGASKLAAERCLEVAARQGLRTASLRLFNVYGSGQNLANMAQGMVSIYLAFLARGEPLVVKGSLDRERDLVHVDDAVDAFKRALRSEARGPFNVGSGQPTTVRGLIDALLQSLQLDAGHPVVEAQGTPGDQFAISADATRIRAELGWEPRKALADGLAEMVAWAATAAPGR